MGNYAYVRVSTKEQNETRQIMALNELCIPKKNIFVEKQSGKDFNRKEYRAMIRKLKKGDVLYITNNSDF